MLNVEEFLSLRGGCSALKSWQPFGKLHRGGIKDGRSRNVGAALSVMVELAARR